MKKLDESLQELTVSEMKETNGGVGILLACCCFGAAVVIGYATAYGICAATYYLQH